MSEVKTTQKTKTVDLYINGTAVGSRPVTESTTVGEFVKDAAREFGVRSFCVMSGTKTVNKDDAEKSVTEFQKIEIVAKDARGCLPCW